MHLSNVPVNIVDKIEVYHDVAKTRPPHPVAPHLAIYTYPVQGYGARREESVNTLVMLPSTAIHS